MQLIPLGHRVHIRPDKPVTETTGGIILAPAYSQQPPMSGTVIAIGLGPAHDVRVRAEAIRDCISVVSEMDEQFRHSQATQACLDELGRLLRREPTPVHDVEIGDRVIFPMDVGHEIVFGEKSDQSTVILNEDSILAVCEQEQIA